MAKTRVFVSFDFDHDFALKTFIVGQSRLEDSPFDIVDHSLQEAAPERDWESKAATAIARSDVVLVIAGQYTYRAGGVLKEIAMARDAGKPLFQIIGYKDLVCLPVPGAGRRYEWTWDNLQKLLS